jgi:hypothetical protein
MSAYGLLAVAYLVVWMAIFIYIARLHFLQRRLANGLERLRSRLGDENRSFIDR